MNISPAVFIDTFINILDNSKSSILNNNQDYIKGIAKIKTLTLGKDIKRAKNSALAVATGFEIFIPLEGLIDIEKEKARINKEIILIEQDKDKCSKKLSNKSFAERAPKEEVEKIKTRLDDAEVKIATLQESLKFIS